MSLWYRFHLESIRDLKTSLREAGSDLLVTVGPPEDVLLRLAKDTGASVVVVQKEVTFEEIRGEQRVSKALEVLGCKLETTWGATMYHIDDIPYGIRELPPVFTTFRKKTEAHARVRPCVPTAVPLPGLPALSEAWRKLCEVSIFSRILLARRVL